MIKIAQEVLGDNEKQLKYFWVTFFGPKGKPQE